MAALALALKSLHVHAVVLSGLLFGLRGLLMLTGSRLGMRAPVRVLSVAIDSALLLAALGLLMLWRLNPLAQPWLAAKLAWLVAYIVLGSFALKRGRRLRTRALCLLLAWLCFAQIVATALTQHPLGLLRLAGT